MHFDHIGWITQDIALFEKFWVDILEFKQVKQSIAAPEMMKVLFGIRGQAEIRRYSNAEFKLDIEIHRFDIEKDEAEFEMYEETQYGFSRHGINHVCIFVKSKEEFLKALPPEVQVHRYDNPGGWTNIFVQDFESNWVELREAM